MTTWRDNKRFNEAMDGVYSSFMKQKEGVEGRHDRDVRDPQIVLGIARELDLLPEPSKIVRVTGSKGKGTTSRMISKALQSLGFARVGLFVSPEEIDHNDRMRINGIPPTRDEFADIYFDLEPALNAAESKLSSGQYISPFGIFLLIALSYFKKSGADACVLEGGRGAEFDEVGNIPSSVAVVTSVLLEHASSIGPEVDDVAANKLFIGTNSDSLITTKTVQEFNQRLKIVPNEKLVTVNESGVANTGFPAWIGVDDALARAAVEKFVGSEVQIPVSLVDSSAAFGLIDNGGQSIYFDGSINLLSIDRSFVEGLVNSGKELVVLASLPDDKDVVRIRDYFSVDLGLPYYELALDGTRGYLHYDNAKAAGTIFDEINYEDTKGFLAVVNAATGGDRSKVVYCIGTQTYIRLVKMALSN